MSAAEYDPRRFVSVELLDGDVAVADFPVERIYRDVRVCQIYEGTSDVQRLVISRQIASE